MSDHNVLNRNAEQYSRKMHIGRKVGDVTIIAITSKSFTVQCNCGEKMTKRHVDPIPVMCKSCNKLAFGEGYKPENKDPKAVVVRENTKIENLMIKKFEGTLTDKEDKKLKKHLKKVKNAK